MLEIALLQFNTYPNILSRFLQVCKNNESAAEQHCSDEEIGEVFHVPTRKSRPLESTKSMDISDTEKSVKILDERKSPISIVDEPSRDVATINV